jgi:hypothetical protein
MDALLQFLETYEFWIYIVLGVVGFIYVRKLIQSFLEWRVAFFGLEKESAQKLFREALTVVILLVLLAMIQFFLVSFVSPIYPQHTIISTPTIEVLTTGISTTGIPNVNLNSGSTPAAQTSSNGCITNQLEWKYPKTGDTISGSVELTGTVNLPSLGFYKYEYNQVGNAAWITIAAGTGVKIQENIGIWDTRQIATGDYLLRLVASDSQNQVIAPCVISVRVVSQ